MSDPYLSVVIVGRNDDYGVNFMSRLNTFVRSLDRQVKNYPNLAELIIVEWNPLTDRARLKDVLASVDNLNVRIITVPNEVHQMIGHPSPVLEYYGKNVGIRRARGQFVLVTNPDIIFTDELINEIAKRNLDPNYFYRTDRYDFVGDGMEAVDPDQYVKFALANTFQGHIASNDGYTTEVMDRLPGRTFDMLPISNAGPDVIHTNGCGDFILAARTAFYRVRGLLESTTELYHIDSISLAKLVTGQYQQHIFASPLCIFHQDHERKPIPVEWAPEQIFESANQSVNLVWGLSDFALEDHEL